jgi:hypothetical protein
MWQIHDSRSLAITRLTALLPSASPGSAPPTSSAIERLELGREYHVPQWIKSGYIDLINQSGQINEADAKRIGFEAYVGITQIRERKKDGGVSDVSKAVEEKWKAEIESAGYHDKEFAAPA